VTAVVGRILVVGLGSMGKRRIRNLVRLGVDRIVGFDPRADRRDEAAAKYGIETVTSFEQGLAIGPDACVISTPPDFHTVYALEAARRGISFFTEAGVLDEGIDELEREVARHDVVAAPSCTARYYPGPQTIRRRVAEGSIGTPHTFMYHSGQWLPDWHPWEDYRDFYASRRATGACREIVPFELAWLTHIFGDVVAVQAFKGKLSQLDADIDDVYQGLYAFSSGVHGMMQVDVLARAPVRHFRLIGSDGTVEWNAIANEVRLFRAGVADWETVSLARGTVEAQYVQWSAEEPYVEEMRDFLSAVRGEQPWVHSLDADRQLLRALYAAEESAVCGERIVIGEATPTAAPGAVL
jgi:predicted dehydrogenase